MAKPDVAAVRAALAVRLKSAYGGTQWHAYPKAFGDMRMPAFVIIPAADPSGRGWYLAQGGDGSDGSCPIRYRFIVEVWAPLSVGVDKAQDLMDAIVSPAGTNAQSIEAQLEDTAEAHTGENADALAELASSVTVEQFTSYGFAALKGEASDAIMARIPVEVLA